MNNKIPQITFAFWVMKICATTLGETAGDLLSMTLEIGYGLSSLILFSFFLITLTLQLIAKKHNPILYWLVILSTSTAGTTMSDYMDRTLGLGYASGSLILLVLLLITLTCWKWAQKTISVDSINSREGESFYWAAILFSNTLGTALGDFLADDTGLGFLGGAILIGSLLLLLIIAHYTTSVSKVVLFWIAFILTRPFGASFGDLLTKSDSDGGLAFGTIGASLFLSCVLVSMMIYLSFMEYIRSNSIR